MYCAMLAAAGGTECNVVEIDDVVLSSSGEVEIWENDDLVQLAFGWRAD
jgi:hypothetical protein